MNGRELLEKLGRNDLCPCGSQRKFKKCCEARLNMELKAGGH